MSRLKKIRKIICLFTVLFLCIGAANFAFGQSGGFKYFKNYSKSDYGRNAQNWGILQSPEGFIYVANHDGLLEYDGASWRVFDLSGSNYSVRSIALGEDGAIYVGGTGEIGFFARQPDGSMNYTSLMGSIEKEFQDFTDVYKTHSTNEGIFFRTKKYLFRWNLRSKKMKVWKPKEAFDASFICNEKYYINEKGIGLKYVTGDSLTLVPGGQAFASKKIYMMTPFSDGSQKLLVGTKEEGLFIYDGQALTPFPTEADDYLKEKTIYYGIRLSSTPGEFAIATLLGGVVIIDSNGKLKHIFDQQSGLQDESVMYVHEDFQGNLWLALNNGISKIEYNSPFLIYDSRSGLLGFVLSVIRHNGMLYSGTSKGLYFRDSSSQWFPIEGITGNCYSLLSTGDTLLAAATSGVFEINNKNIIIRKIIDGPSYTLIRSRKDNNRVWVGTKIGLVSLSLENNKWTPGPPFKDITQRIYSIVENFDGNLWLGTLSQGAIKVDFPVNGSIEKPLITVFLKSNGLTEGEIRVFETSDHIIFGTEKGLFRFDEKTKTFIPDNTLGKEYAGSVNNKNNVFRLAQDNDQTIWFHSLYRNFHAIPKPDGSFFIDSTPFLRTPSAQVNSFYPDPEGNITWLASYDGLIGFDKNKHKNYYGEYRAFIRNAAIINGKSLNLAGAFPRIEYKDRNLRLEFGAPFFEDESSTQYQVLLEGYDKTWSPWTSETKKDYTNLDPGDYTFKVRAKNVYGQLSKEDDFQFKVFPPWYRTWWMLLIYAVLFLLLMFLLFKWRSRTLEKDKKRLERTVEERTKEIHEKNLQLEKQTLLLEEQSGKLKEMDRVKSRFFANISHEFRTPLTLIMGPLEQMISVARHKEEKEQLNVMLRSSSRLLMLVNQLLDLSKLDSGKMKLQAGRYNIITFLKGILESFHLLAAQNKLELKFISGQDDITLYFDPAKLEEVVCNLMINAVKFTPPGGSISISVKMKSPQPKETEFLEISVRDTGIGIPKDQLASIFNRFYQVEGAAGESAYKGTGIGLSLARELIYLHHGEMDVQSDDGENKGTEFIIRLPMGEEHLKPEEITDRHEIPSFCKKAEEAQAIYLKEEKENGEPENNAPCAESEPDAQEKSIILIVEDNEDVRNYIRRPLESTHRVVEAANGKEGIKIAKEIIPDLIVSDIMMPEMDGNELCRAIKKDISTSHIPVVLLTAKASEESIIQGLKAGADDYITKPFNTKILCARIENLIELRRQMQLKIQRQKMLLPAEITVSSMDEEFLKEFQGIIEKNLSEPELNIELLCKKLYMGRATLFRKILALTGETPKQFIQSYRLERAAQLLKGNFGNVTEVAFKVGFSSTAYFTKCFREKFNRLPSSFMAAEA